MLNKVLPKTQQLCFPLSFPFCISSNNWRKFSIVSLAPGIFYPFPAFLRKNFQKIKLFNRKNNADNNSNSHYYCENQRGHNTLLFPVAVSWPPTYGGQKTLTYLNKLQICHLPSSSRFLSRKIFHKFIFPTLNFAHPLMGFVKLKCPIFCFQVSIPNVVKSIAD